MYAQKSFREDRIPVLQDFVRTRPFATLVGSSPGQGIQVSHLPLLLETSDGLGRLKGHLARANPHCSVLEGGDAVAVFQGPHAYVSPNWYASKEEHGRVVPTWNYLAVHARGPVRLLGEDELRTLLEDLTDEHEASQPTPWRVSDAPEDFIQASMRAIAGFEMEIRSLEGIWKMSQNRSTEDQSGAVAGLREGSATEREVADCIARVGGKE